MYIFKNNLADLVYRLHLNRFYTPVVYNAIYMSGDKYVCTNILDVVLGHSDFNQSLRLTEDFIVEVTYSIRPRSGTDKYSIVLNNDLVGILSNGRSCYPDRPGYFETSVVTRVATFRRPINIAEFLILNELGIFVITADTLKRIKEDKLRLSRFVSYDLGTTGSIRPRKYMDSELDWISDNYNSTDVITDDLYIMAINIPILQGIDVDPLYDRYTILTNPYIKFLPLTAGSAIDLTRGGGEFEQFADTLNFDVLGLLPQNHSN